MNKLTVKDVDVKGKKVLVRCDFNVPMKDGKITDETRILGARPRIKYLMEHRREDHSLARIWASLTRYSLTK